MGAVIDRVFVVNSQTFSSEHGYADASAVVAGKLAFFDESFTGWGTASLAPATATFPPKMRMVYGATNPLYSRYFDKRNVVSVRKAAYRAPTAQVTTLGALTVANTGPWEYLVRIELRDWIPTYTFKSFVYKSVTVPGDGQVVYDAIAALINAEDANFPVSAAVSGMGGASTLILTGAAGRPFDVSLEEGLGQGAVTNVTSVYADDGSGTYEQVAYLEFQSRGSYGKYTIEQFLATKAGQDLYQTGELTPGLVDLYGAPTNAVAGTTYDMYIIEHKNDAEASINRPMLSTLTIVAVATTVDTSALDTFFNTLSSVIVELGNALGAVTLSSPADGATGVAINVTLSWAALAGADSYEWQLAEANTFATLFDLGSGTALNSGALALTNSTEYFWRVRGVNEAGNGAWSVTRSFTTIAL